MREDHVIDYSSPGIKGDGAAILQRRIIAFVRGIRRPRQNPVSSSQIKRWFRATPPEFVDAQIDAVIISGKIKISQKTLSSGRRFNGAYVYEVS